MPLNNTQLKEIAEDAGKMILENTPEASGILIAVVFDNTVQQDAMILHQTKENHAFGHLIRLGRALITAQQDVQNTIAARLAELDEIMRGMANKIKNDQQNSPNT